MRSLFGQRQVWREQGKVRGIQLVMRLNYDFMQNLKIGICQLESAVAWGNRKKGSAFNALIVLVFATIPPWKEDRGNFVGHCVLLGFWSCSAFGFFTVLLNQLCLIIISIFFGKSKAIFEPVEVGDYLGSFATVIVEGNNSSRRGFLWPSRKNFRHVKPFSLNCLLLLNRLIKTTLRLWWGFCLFDFSIMLKRFWAESFSLLYATWVFLVKWVNEMDLFLLYEFALIVLYIVSITHMDLIWWIYQRCECCFLSSAHHFEIGEWDFQVEMSVEKELELGILVAFWRKWLFLYWNC